MALKCGNCIYFVKAGWFSSYCDYKRRMNDKNDLTSENSIACNHYDETTDYNKDLSNNGKTSDCFLTSACTEYLGKADNCEELTLLRKFRDGYLRGLPNGEDLISEYYLTAPKIIEKIKDSQKEQEYFEYIYSVIIKCVSLINEKKDEETLAEYISMVKRLKQLLLN